jgi:putative AlgH/UPF0301 family transcriptional regulator
MAMSLIIWTVAITAAPIFAQENTDTPRTPFLLVANPDIPDPVFQQTVILILPPSQLPLVAGIVINKPSKMTLGQLFHHSSAVRNPDQLVYFGGSVNLTSPAILMRAARAPDATTHVFDDVYISDDAGAVSEVLKRPGSDKDTRLFLGRAQWTVDQLHAEILSGAWIITKARSAAVFSAERSVESNAAICRYGSVRPAPSADSPVRRVPYCILLVTALLAGYRPGVDATGTVPAEAGWRVAPRLPVSFLAKNRTCPKSP